MARRRRFQSVAARDHAEAAVRDEDYWDIQYVGKRYDKRSGPFQLFTGHNREGQFFIGVGRSVVTDSHGNLYGDELSVIEIKKVPTTGTQLKLFKNPILPTRKTAQTHQAYGMSPKWLTPYVWYQHTTLAFGRWEASVKLKDGVWWEVRAKATAPASPVRSSDYKWDDVEAIKHIPKHLSQHESGHAEYYRLFLPYLQPNFPSTDDILDLMEREYILSPGEYLYYSAKRNPVTKEGENVYWNRPGLFRAFHSKGKEFLTHGQLDTAPYWHGNYWTRVAESPPKHEFLYDLVLPQGDISVTYRLQGFRLPDLRQYDQGKWRVTLSGPTPGNPWKPLLMGSTEIASRRKQDSIVTANKVIPWAEDLILSPDAYLYWGSRVRHLKSNRRGA